MDAPQSHTLYSLIREQAARFPDGLAVIDRGQETTYAGLAARIGRVAAGLRVRGIGRRSRVGILIDNRREWLEAAIGATATGAVAVPFSTFSKAAELEFLFADADVDALVVVGERDEATPPPMSHELAAGLPHARLKIIAGCAHVPQLQAPRAFLDTIADFLAAQAANQPAESPVR